MVKINRKIRRDEVSCILESFGSFLSFLQIKTKQPDGPVFPISRGCQASGSLYHCESCSSASKVIADLSGILGTALQDNGLSSSVVKER